MFVPLIPSWKFTLSVWKKWTICLDYPDFHREMSCSLLQLRLILSCGYLTLWWLDTSCGCLRFRWVDTSYGWFHFTADSISSGCIRVATDSILRPTLFPVTWYELRLILSCGWLEFWQLDTSYSWLHPTADSSSDGWIRLQADLILRRTQVLPAGLDLQWTYALIYQVNLRDYSVKHTIFIFFDFSFHWFKLWLLTASKTLKKLEGAWGNLKKLQESNCSGWFEACDQSTAFRIFTRIPIDDGLTKFIMVEKFIVCKRNSNWIWRTQSFRE